MLKETEEKALAKGIEKGIEKGRKEGIINTAKNLITMNISIENIAKATGLTQGEIAKLKN